MVWFQCMELLAPIGKMGVAAIAFQHKWVSVILRQEKGVRSTGNMSCDLAQLCS